MRVSLPFCIAFALAGLPALVAVASPAAAQLRPMPVPAALTEVKLLSQSPTETHLLLTLTPKVNGFTTSVNDPNRPGPGLGLALTSRGNSAVTPQRLDGIVRAISFEQIDSVLILRFATAGSASVSAVATSDTTIEVTVATRTARAARVSDDDGPGGSVPEAVTPRPGEDGFELVQLKYADISEVVGLLTDGQTIRSNDIFIPRPPAFGSNSLTGSAYSPQPTIPPPGSDDRPLGQSVDSSIAVDRRLNAIWLKGSPERIARMKAMIALIDVPVDTVMLETELVELTESGARAIGLDFNNANGQIGIATVETGKFILPGYPPNSRGVRLTSGALQAALYAQIQKGNGKIVSKPRIAAQSGSTAKIVTGDALPILTAITLSGVNGVSQQVQYVNVGVTLQIAPRVSADGYVTSHIFSVVSSVSGYAQGYPTISQREAETSASVKDGDSFVIGGLTQESSLKSRNKVPLLGDIPLLGQAFRTDRETRGRTELYIVVTPHIVKRTN